MYKKVYKRNKPTNLLEQKKKKKKRKRKKSPSNTLDTKEREILINKRNWKDEWNLKLKKSMKSSRRFFLTKEGFSLNYKKKKKDI